MRPICFLDVPPALAVDAKRKLVRRVSAAVAEACGRETDHVELPSGSQVKTNWVLTFFREYPLDRAALGDLLAQENPMVLESISTAG
jgi:uncharacterized SAM-dependent methyltransferase